MPASYRHTQFGYVTALPCTIVGIWSFGSLWWMPIEELWVLRLLATVGVVATILCFLFASLSVEVDNGQVRLRFGTGTIHKTIPLTDIKTSRIARNSLLYGFGIRLTPHGWLWNVSGLSAVEVEYRNGKKFRIGTDQPEALQHAIQQQLPA
ncbi:MAG: hypothetical protein HY696_10850 [Deltaproteobacteria bacterium]|nr:hypothetical protein [Deltaproteobacteria bacterium]